MTEHKPQSSRRIQAGNALSPSGRLMTFKDLPPQDTQRWVIRRKAEVVAGVHGGLISLEQACRRYELSIDEFRSWEKLLKAHGLAGLRTTRARKYRRLETR
jgi:hypothetical protein